MKKVKNLNVTVTYKVGLGDVEMPESAYNEIVKAVKNGKEIEAGGLMYSHASQWLADNIREGDCFEWKAEIDDVS